MTALIFLLKTVFYSVATLFLLRFFMQAFCVSFINPLGNFVLKITAWAVIPARKIIPSFFKLDIASFLLALLTVAIYKAIEFALLGTTVVQWLPFLAVFSLWVVFAFIGLIVQLFIFAILIFAIASWLAPFHPMMLALSQFTRPLLLPIRRIIPPIAGVDLSPVIALILLEAILIFLRT